MRKVPKYRKIKTSNITLPVDYGALNPKSLRSYDVPTEYKDEIKNCRYCNSEFVVTAQHKKFLYEIAKRHVATRKVLCEKCRMRIKFIDDKVAELIIKIGPKGHCSVASKKELNEGIELLDEKWKILGRCDYAKYSRISNLRRP